jgi:hypothetical protein
VISEDDVARVREQLGEFAIASLRIDLDGFLEVVDQVGSPQALSHGFSPQVVASAAEWQELALLLKPFRDEARQRIAAIRAEREGEDVAPAGAACPGCGERRVDELVINDDGSVLCLTCGRRYQLPGEGEPRV